MTLAMDRSVNLSRQLLCCVAIAVAICGLSAAASESKSAGDAALFDRLDTDGNGALSAGEVSPEHGRLLARLLRRGDLDGDSALSRDEFLAALVPSRPEKPIEEKQPADFPQARAVRYLLLALDTNANRSIEADEVPESLQPVFDALANRLDRNKNHVLETVELGRGGRPLAQIAGRYVARERIDLAAELDKFEKSQGAAARRFDEQPRPVEMLADPRQARVLFTRLDANSDGHVAPQEVPDSFRSQVKRFLRVADRNRDGRLSEREFLAGGERISRFLSRRRDPGVLRPQELPQREPMPAEK